MLKKVIILTQFILILSTTSCKYEDGPKMSLRSKTHRLINSWTIDKVYESGTDKTNEYKKWLNDFRIDLRKDNSYTITYYPDPITYYNWTSGKYHEKGLWAFSDDKKEAILMPNYNVYYWDTMPRYWKIIRLKENSLWIKGDISGDGIVNEAEVHFK